MRCISEWRLTMGAYGKITALEWCHHSSPRQRRLMLVVSEVCTRESDFSGVPVRFMACSESLQISQPLHSTRLKLLEVLF